MSTVDMSRWDELSAGLTKNQKKAFGSIKLFGDFRGEDIGAAGSTMRVLEGLGFVREISRDKDSRVWWQATPLVRGDSVAYLAWQEAKALESTAKAESAVSQKPLVYADFVETPCPNCSNSPIAIDCEECGNMRFVYISPSNNTEEVEGGRS